jgi:hypothetical protein
MTICTVPQSVYLNLTVPVPVCVCVCVCAGKRDTGMVVKMGSMHYKSESLTFSADALGYGHHPTLPHCTLLYCAAIALPCLLCIAQP